MAQVDPRLGHPNFPQILVNPSTPLAAYSPGQLSKLNPEERGNALKRKKRLAGGPALTTASVLQSS